MGMPEEIDLDPHAPCRERLARAEEAAAAHEARLGEWEDDRARLTARLAELERERQEIAQASADATRRYLRAEQERDALRERVAGLEAALRRHGGHVGPCATFGKLNKHGVYIPRSPGPCDCGYEAALAAPGPTP